MDIEKANSERLQLNNLLNETDSFFNLFSELDNKVYMDGAIPKKYKELTGLAISVVSKCEECVLYHLQECIAEGAGKDEIIESIKMGVMGGGSITYPTARFAIKKLKELAVL